MVRAPRLAWRLRETRPRGSGKVSVFAVGLTPGSQPCGLQENRRIFWFTGIIFTCSLIQTFFRSHNKQLHPTLAWQRQSPISAITV